MISKKSIQNKSRQLFKKRGGGGVEVIELEDVVLFTPL